MNKKKYIIDNIMSVCSDNNTCDTLDSLSCKQIIKKTIFLNISKKSKKKQIKNESISSLHESVQSNNIFKK